MEPALCSRRLPGHIDSRLRPVRPTGGHLPALQWHLSPGLLQQRSPHHPQIGQRKQRHQLRRVLGQSPVTYLSVVKLALDDSKPMFDLGPHTGLKFLGLFGVLAPRRALLGGSFARAHGHLPWHTRGLRPFVCALIPGVHAIVDLHPKVPLVALLGLVHLRVMFTAAVLGGARRGNQGRIHHAAGLKKQPLLGQGGVDGGHDAYAQFMFFEQMAKAQDGALIGQSFDCRCPGR